MTAPPIEELARGLGDPGPWQRATGGLNVVWLGRDTVIKAYLPQDADEALIERDALEQVAGRLPAATPEVLQSTIHGDWPVVVMRRLRGTPALEAGLDATGWRRLARQAGEWLAALHAIAPPPSVRARRPDLGAWLREHAPSTLERHRREGLRTELVAALSDLADAHGFPDDEAVFAHADLHDENVLVDANGDLCAVLDFGDAVGAPAAFDFVCPVTSLGRGDPAAIAALYDGYRACRGGEVDRRDVARCGFLHPWVDLAPRLPKNVEALWKLFGA